MGWCGFGWVGGLWGQVFVGPGNRVGLRWMLGVRFATLVYPLLPIHPSATLTLLTILLLPFSFPFPFVPFYPLPLPSFFIVSTSPQPINLVHVLIYCPIHLPPSCLYIHATTNTTNESSHESHEYRKSNYRKSKIGTHIPVVVVVAHDPYSQPRTRHNTDRTLHTFSILPPSLANDPPHRHLEPGLGHQVGISGGVSATETNVGKLLKLLQKQRLVKR